MAKTRLNQTHRETLMIHAASLVSYDDAAIAECRKAIDAAVTTWAAMFALLKAEIDKEYPAAEMDVLEKHGMISEVQTRLILIDPDLPEEGGRLGEVALIEGCYRLRSVPAQLVPEHFHREGCVTYRVRTAALANVIEWPNHDSDETNVQLFRVPKKTSGWSNAHNCKIVTTPKIKKAREAAIKAGNQAQSVLDKHEEVANRTVRAYNDLIRSARTFEDVVEIWPEASQVTHIIKGSGTELMAVPKTTIDAIWENMRRRGVAMPKASAAE